MIPDNVDFKILMKKSQQILTKKRGDITQKSQIIKVRQAKAIIAKQAKRATHTMHKQREPGT
jgi:hypothetical protein